MKAFFRKSAFTLIELLVVIAIIALLAGLLFPLFGRVLAQSRATKCAQHLRQLGTAALMYAGDNEMTLPVTVHQRRSGGRSWAMTLQQYASGRVTFRCPDDEVKTRLFTYVINDFLTPRPAGAPDLNFSVLTRLERPRETFLFAEASSRYTESDHFHFTRYRGRPIPPTDFEGQVAVRRHQGSANYVFADGHLETLSWEQAQQLLTTPGSRFTDPTAGTHN